MVAVFCSGGWAVFLGMGVLGDIYAMEERTFNARETGKEDRRGGTRKGEKWRECGNFVQYLGE